ncbi:DNA adenine methylase [Aeoliella mucimassa]|nr:DNA adenine methylase [Aeoliella mucimassa]
MEQKLAKVPCRQLELWTDTERVECRKYLSSQLITYIGNKRSLLNQIKIAVEHVKNLFGRDGLRTADIFSGSGVVSRLLKGYSSYLVSNDLEDYAAIIARCYLANRSEVNLTRLGELVADLNARVDNVEMPEGFIRELYSPRDEKHIKASDRVFYTIQNARRLDNYRRLIAETPKRYHDFLLAPLLSEASVHANTAGVFKGFYKNRNTKIGQFGGSGADALQRILGEIKLEVPVLSQHECRFDVYSSDANDVVRQVRDLDLAYFDPPYNQHPYGSNYFMLNLIASYKRPDEISQVSGIPVDWNRSDYNVRARAFERMADLVENTDAKFLLISFNDEGFISPSEMRGLLADFGTVKEYEHQYNAFRGSRSFKNRPIHVTEHLFLVEKR